MLYPKMGIADLLDVSLKKTLFSKAMCVYHHQMMFIHGVPTRSFADPGCLATLPCGLQFHGWHWCNGPSTRSAGRSSSNGGTTLVPGIFAPTRDGVMGTPPSPPKDFHKILNMSFLCAHGASMFHVGIFLEPQGFHKGRNQDVTRVSCKSFRRDDYIIT